MVGLEFAGDKNSNQKTRFRFACDDPECEGKKTFHAAYDSPPELVPSGMPCPFGGDHDAVWIVDKIGSVHIAGKAGGADNPFYTTERAQFEHEWMANEIENTKKALNAEDQLTGKAKSPYAKMNPNMDALVEAGIAKPDDAETAAQKKRIQDERSKIIMDDVSEKLTDTERQHAGRRHDG
jgi:hypothetical protein